MIIGKHFEFEASHKLPDKAIYGACSKLHGHTYKLTVEVEGEITPFGWVMNFKELKEVINRKVISAFDHNYINDIIAIPTAENMLVWIKEQIEPELSTKLKSLTLYETSNSYAKLIC